MRYPSLKNRPRQFFIPRSWRILLTLIAACACVAGVNATEPAFRDPAGKHLTETEYKEIIRSWRKGLNEGQTPGRHFVPAEASGLESTNPPPVESASPVNTKETPVVIPEPVTPPDATPSNDPPPATTQTPAKSKPDDIDVSNIRLILDPRPEEGWEELKTEDPPKDAASVFDIEKPKSPPPSPPPGTVQKPAAYIERTIQVPGGGSMTVREFLYE